MRLEDVDDDNWSESSSMVHFDGEFLKKKEANAKFYEFPVLPPLNSSRYYLRAVNFDRNSDRLILRPIDGENKALLFQLYLPIWPVLAAEADGRDVKDVKEEREMLIFATLFCAATLDVNSTLPSNSDRCLTAMGFNPADRTFSLNRCTKSGRRYTLVTQMASFMYNDPTKRQWEDLKIFIVRNTPQYDKWINGIPLVRGVQPLLSIPQVAHQGESFRKDNGPSNSLHSNQSQFQASSSQAQNLSAKWNYSGIEDTDNSVGITKRKRNQFQASYDNDNKASSKKKQRKQ